MGLDRCLPSLAQGAMGMSMAGHQLEKDRPVVMGARTWLAASSPNRHAYTEADHRYCSSPK